MTDNTKKGPVAEGEATAIPDGACAVDIRIFLLTITLAMSAAFMAGVSIHLPLDNLMQRPAPVGVDPAVRNLEISPADLTTAGSHSPSGQHLLVDIIGIEAAFLDSEERLSDAMVRTVQGAGLTMLSYHCHKLDPAGISCVGVLLESHISFHTWPEEGVITLDLFTCGPNPLLPVVPVIEELFGIGENVRTKWSHELRGFRSDEERRNNYLDNFSDLSLWVLSPIELHSKTQVYSNLTKYQRVDIWDFVEEADTPSYADGIKHNIPVGDPRWESPDLYTPDRILFLDGTVQSLYSSESTYHEALVHPTMLAHSGPKNVGVLGGGEGATIREVLKHKTVERVTMIEIDEELIEIVREYLPQLNDCSDIVGRADNCFDDQTVNLVLDNAVRYFHDRHGPERAVKYAPKPFDILIVDALDPEDDVLFANDLYADDAFLTAMLGSMSDDGVLMIQIGTAPDLSDPKADVGVYQIREQLFALLEAHAEVEAMFVFEEPEAGFLEPHSFLIVCKDSSCRDRWNARSDAVDFELYDRILPTKSGKPALKYYDGTVQALYQSVPKAWETVYCRREPTPFECSYVSLDFDREIHEFSFNDGEGSFTLEMKEDENGQVVGASVFAKTNIPKGSFIMPDHLASSLILSEGNVDEIKKHVNDSPTYKELASFIDSWAHKSSSDGVDSQFLEVGASTLIRKVEGDKVNVGRWVPPHPTGKRPSYSPVYDRHQVSFEVFLVALEDIPAGTELTRSADV